MPICPITNQFVKKKKCKQNLKLRYVGCRSCPENKNRSSDEFYWASTKSKYFKYNKVRNLISGKQITRTEIKY